MRTAKGKRRRINLLTFDLFINIIYLFRPQTEEEVARLFFREFRIVRFHANAEAILARAPESRAIEDRMIRPWQAIHEYPPAARPDGCRPHHTSAEAREKCR